MNSQYEKGLLRIFAASVSEEKILEEEMSRWKMVYESVQYFLDFILRFLLG